MESASETKTTVPQPYGCEFHNLADEEAMSLLRSRPYMASQLIPPELPNDAKQLIDWALALMGGYDNLVDKLAYKSRTLQRVRTGELPMSNKLRKQIERLLIEGKASQSLAKYGKIEPNIDPNRLHLRAIPVYSWVQAGQATEFENLPESWEDEVAYLGDDPKAFGLRIVGDSMEPRYSPGDIVVVCPKYVAITGDRVVASVKNEGVLFKLMHHNGEGKTIQLLSYNIVYPPLTFAPEDFHWIYPVKQVIKP